MEEVGPEPKEEEEAWEDEPEAAAEAGDDVLVVVAPCQDIRAEGVADAKVAVSVQVPDGVDRIPTDVCCVVDISGSMRSPATYEADGVTKSDGLSILDIVTHAVKAVMYMLKETDRFALVAFDDSAELVLELTQMTESGREAAVAALASLVPRGRTNIWGGVLAGMEALRTKRVEDGNRQQALLLLTDGQPNISPPRGHVSELQDYMERYPGFNFQLNTFGFGYDLNSEILLELAAEGNGTYAFIPDAVIVGTVFVNSIANVLSTRTQATSLHLMPKGDAIFTGPVCGSHKVTEASWGRVVSLGPLQVGQARDVVVPMQIPPGDGVYLEVAVTYPMISGDGEKRSSAQASARTATEDAVVAACRSEIVDVGLQATKDGVANKGATAAGAVKGLAARLAERQGGPFGDSERLASMRGDVDGRMSKALKGKERFNRWGKHYLRALTRSHQLQLCTNFMDVGLQGYGGNLFTNLRSQGDSIFLSLPLPNASGNVAAAPVLRTYQPPPMASTPTYVASPPPVPTASSSSGRPRSPSPQPEARRYYAGAGGGCFGGSSTVLVVDRHRDRSCALVRRTRVVDVRPGDEVLVAGGGFARVHCVVVIPRPSSRGLVQLPCGLTITGGHPVRIGGVWCLPRDLLGTVRVQHDGSVYNFLLDQRNAPLLVDGIECATWGHGLDGEVISHPYFGTERIIQDLAASPGWAEGVVKLSIPCPTSWTANRADGSPAEQAVAPAQPVRHVVLAC